MAHRFRWILPGRLAGMVKTGSYQDLDTDLTFLVQRGIIHVVTLTERPLPPAALGRHGLQGYHLPVVDFAVPQLEEAVALCRHVERALGADEPVVMHCAAGLGRTGTMLASYHIYTGMPARRAVHEVRAVEPLYIQSDEQEQFLYDLQAYLGLHEAKP
jgi:atypical dual specificity phosphatase